MKVKFPTTPVDPSLKKPIKGKKPKLVPVKPIVPKNPKSKK